MISAQIGDAISIAFYNLSQTNSMLYDYWLTELYDEEGVMIESEWNEETLKLMETDVMQQMQATD